MIKVRKNVLSLLLGFSLLFLLAGCKPTASYDAGLGSNKFSMPIDFDKSPNSVFDSALSLIKKEYIDKTYNYQSLDRWKTRYEKTLKTNEDAYIAVDSMVESLNDPYTRFLKPSDFQEQDRSIESKLCGIGVHIADINGKIMVVDVIDATPAKKAGMIDGDVLLKIDSVSLNGMTVEKAAQLVRGKAGTKVNLVILRNKHKLSKSIIRKQIEIKTVNYKTLNKDLAYIRIDTFISNETAIEMYNALLKTKNSRAVIIDIRGNHGGLLPNAILIANMFIKNGPIVSIIDRDGNKEVIKAESDNQVTQKPIAVLINQTSASASEILSGALKDHKRAILVGEKTYGKGCVQRIERLPGGSGINITVAKYLTPNGTDINKKGIKPDYKVEYTKSDFILKRDPQLAKAKLLLETQLAKLSPAEKNFVVLEKSF